MALVPDLIAYSWVKEGNRLEQDARARACAGLGPDCGAIRCTWCTRKQEGFGIGHEFIG